MLFIIAGLLFLILLAIVGGRRAVRGVVGLVVIIAVFLIILTNMPAHAAILEAADPCADKTPIEIVRCHGPYPAAKFITIEDNDGGNVLSFSNWFAILYKSGIPVHIKGDCISACTMVLALGSQACLESGAKLGFHVASINGKVAAAGTVKMANDYYPSNIRKWFLDTLITREKKHQDMQALFWATDKELIATGTMHACLEESK